MKRSLAIVLFLLWTGTIISAYYVVQKPDLLTAFTGLIGTLWTLIVAALLLFNAYGIGARVLHWLALESIEATDHLLLSCGIGLGALGLLGLGFSAAQLAHGTILSIFQIGLALFFVLRNDVRKLADGLKVLAAEWNLSFSQYSLLTKIAILLPLLLSFLLTLVPPFEAFDALSYHLAQPARILQDGGLHPVDIPTFWYPNLTENTYLWALAFHSERATQILHFLWAMLSALLLWRWAIQTWDMEIGRKTLLILSTISSLPMLASWAYVDMTLAYYAIAALYAYSLSRSGTDPRWLRITAMMAGLAMGVKYTSFTIPLTCGLLILSSGPFGKAISSAGQFSMISILVALPWYVRNAVLMGNPFYPFVFGGLYWNQFRAEWFNNAGTGVGWNVLQILLIPFNIVLGYKELTPMDGRIGPMFLILLPFTLWTLFSRAHQDSARSLSLRALSLFVTLSFAAWTLGVIKSAVLWQIRLFFPALFAFAIPTALGWNSLKRLDTPKLRIGFLTNVVIAVVIALTLFDNAVFVVQRNPLAVALGAQSRQAYIERVNPSYAALIKVVDELPADARIYSLFEPRSYGLPRRIQPDLALYNFAHDLYLYETPSEIIKHWKAKQFTHVIVYERGLTLGENDPSGQFTPTRGAALHETLAQLQLIGQTPDGAYSIYRIP